MFGHLKLHFIEDRSYWREESLHFTGPMHCALNNQRYMYCKPLYISLASGKHQINCLTWDISIVRKKTKWQ